MKEREGRILFVCVHTSNFSGFAFFAILTWLFLFIALFRVVLSRTRYTPSTTTTTTATPAIYILLLVSARKNISVLSFVHFESTLFWLLPLPIHMPMLIVTFPLHDLLFGRNEIAVHAGRSLWKCDVGIWERVRSCVVKHPSKVPESTGQCFGTTRVECLDIKCVGRCSLGKGLGCRNIEEAE